MCVLRNADVSLTDAEKLSLLMGVVNASLADPGEPGPVAPGA